METTQNDEKRNPNPDPDKENPGIPFDGPAPDPENGSSKGAGTERPDPGKTGANEADGASGGAAPFEENWKRQEGFEAD